MNMRIRTSGVDFDFFISLFNQLHTGSSEESKTRFMTIISKLESYLQLLDTGKKDESCLQELHDASVLKLKYWQRLLGLKAYLFNSDLRSKKILKNSLLFCLNYLMEKLEAAEMNRYNSKFERFLEEVKNILPHPDKHFAKYVDNIPDIELSSSDLLIIQFVDNYISNPFFGQYATEVEVNFFSELKRRLKIDSYYHMAVDNYAQADFNSSRVVELPVYIYLDTNDTDDIKNYYAAVKKLMTALDVEPFFEYPPILGSWIKTLIARCKKVVSSEEVTAGLKKVQHGIETFTINKTQSEINKNLAEALAALVTATVAIPRLSTLLGSLLIIKITNSKNEPVIVARTLTIAELIFLNEHPSLLQRPDDILMELASIKELEG